MSDLTSKQLSVVIPAYNEGHRIVETVQEISRFCNQELDAHEIIVVDDGSTDATASAAGSLPEVKLLENGGNRGKGYSVRRGILETKLDPVLFTDADLSTPIAEALPLLEALRNGADIAIASRTRSPDKKVSRSVRRRLMAWVFRLLVKTIALRGFHDTQCGFKMFRSGAAREIFGLQRLDRWGFDVEVLYLARKLGLTVREVPVAWQESSETRLKLTTPLTMIGDLLEVRWNDILGRYRFPSERGSSS
jgi:glycosyltransferase involved in cell wall biosynthesis